MAGERPQMQRRMEPLTSPAGQGQAPTSGEISNSVMTAQIPSVAAYTRTDIERGYSTAVNK